MRRRMEKRFIFTQLSAVPIFFAAMAAVDLLVLQPLVRPFAIRFDAAANVWIRVGLLTAENAKGYPYSKPWKR